MRILSFVYWFLLSFAFFCLVPVSLSCQCHRVFKYWPNVAISTNFAYFCGEHLEQQSDILHNSCDPSKLYLCSRSQINGTAIPIARCSHSTRKQSINTCNTSFKSRNACLRNMKCSCSKIRFSRDQVVCGKLLHGFDCNDNVLYQCRMIGKPLPLEHCPHGCGSDRQCSKPITEVVDEVLDASWHNSSTNNSADSGINSSTEGLSPVNGDQEQEVEFVTFAPLVRTPHINP